MVRLYCNFSFPYSLLGFVYEPYARQGFSTSALLTIWTRLSCRWGLSYSLVRFSTILGFHTLNISSTSLYPAVLIVQSFLQTSQWPVGSKFDPGENHWVIRVIRNSKLIPQIMSLVLFKPVRNKKDRGKTVKLCQIGGNKINIICICFCLESQSRKKKKIFF